VGDEAAVRLIDKLRDFSDSLSVEERVLLGVLLAPGIVRAYDASPEVTGFAMLEWSPDALASSLGRALRGAGIWVSGLDSSDSPP
jgi:hypothetical protein